MAEFYIRHNGDVSASLYSPKQTLTITRSILFFCPLQFAQTPGPARSPSMLISGTLEMSGMSDFQVCLLKFKKGAKRDLSTYHTFKNEEFCNSFFYSFHTTARAQGLGDMLDPKFHAKHSDTSAQLLVGEQQSFMYSVLVVTLPTKSEKELTKEFDNLWLIDNYKGMTQQFPTHFKEKLCLLDRLEENLTKFSRLLVLFFSNKQLSPLLTFTRLVSWILFGTIKPVCLALSPTKAIMSSSRVWSTITRSLSTLL